MEKKKILSYDKLLSEEEKQNIIQDYVVNLLSIRDLLKKYNIKSNEFIKKLLKGKTRSLSESSFIAHKHYPEKFKHSEESKAKLREKRLQYMKAHPENTPWRKRGMSYPEKMFHKFLTENDYYNKFTIINEYPVFPYSIDFAILDKQIAIEIDGSQHLLEENKKRDEKKDELLLSKGWRVLRISEKTVKTDWIIVKKEIDKLIEDASYISEERLGELKFPKKRERKERGIDGKTEGERQRILNSRKVKNRPSKEELLKLIIEKPFTQIGKMYGVFDNTIRKWCKNYGIPYRRKDINNLLNSNNFCNFAI